VKLATTKIIKGTNKQTKIRTQGNKNTWGKLKVSLIQKRLYNFRARLALSGEGWVEFGCLQFLFSLFLAT
jgi:hypothetical protein